jgi:hypothetical protein
MDEGGYTIAVDAASETEVSFDFLFLLGRLGVGEKSFAKNTQQRLHSKPYMGKI